MPAEHYFEGGECDYFVKPVIFSMEADGESARWATPEDGKPDVWSVYRYKHFLKEVVSDHLTLEPALEEAERLAKQDKALALLKGIPL